jgi:hypothetical protein
VARRRRAERFYACGALEGFRAARSTRTLDIGYDTLRRRYTKFEAATTQLNRALVLYLDDADYLSAITLAGAAEEPLGKLVEKAGGKNRLASESSAVAAIHLQLYDEPLHKKDAIAVINLARNSLKHLGGGDDFEIDPKEEAYHIIDRALGNYLQLSNDIAPHMQRFLELRGPDV